MKLHTYKTDDSAIDTVSEPAVAYAYTHHTAEGKSTEKVKSYAYLKTEIERQRRLIAEGKMTRPALTDDVFTLEQETEFNKKITIDDIFLGR